MDLGIFAGRFGENLDIRKISFLGVHFWGNYFSEAEGKSVLDWEILGTLQAYTFCQARHYVPVAAEFCPLELIRLGGQYNYV